MKAPPLLVSFSSTENFLKALPHEVRASYGLEFQRLASKGLPPVVSIRCLATLFGYSPKFVGALYFRTERYYRTFYLPKGKRKRIIHAPRVALKAVQKWLGHHLADSLTFDQCVFGFVKGRSAIQGATLHCGANWIFSVDIKDFFPSTPTLKIIEKLMSIGYPRHGAEIIGKLCSYGGFLAQGSPASPVLSNIVFKEADAELSSLAQQHHIQYTRYADDIVFSGKAEFPSDLKKEVKALVERHGWRLASGKERYSDRPNRLKVYGLLVHGPRPRLTKGYRNRIRAFKHLLSANKVLEEDIQTVKGHIAYARSVEDIE